MFSNPKQKTFRSPEYLDWVRQQECCVCGTTPPTEAHHLIGTGKLGGMGMKAPDWTCIPVCHHCHQNIHMNPVLVEHQWEWMARTLGRYMEEGAQEMEKIAI